jgi:acetate kinase
MPTEELAATLEHRSGLLGLAGTADMRAILAAEAAGDEAAILAIGVYLHRLRASIAAMVAALGGLDVLVFTGGVGERAPSIRERVAVDLPHLGVAVDPTANAAAEADADIGAPEARVRTLVVTAREDLEIAREVRATLGLRTAS